VFTLFLQDAWKVLLYSLVLGAGLPVVYALGVRALSIGGAIGGAGGTEAPATGGAPAVRRNVLGTALATLCFLVVLAGIAVGLTYIVASGQGKVLSFDHVYPTLAPKS
jgi:hypothetical protein